MALNAKLPDRAAFKHLRILRSMRSVACRTALELERAMFEDERSLLVGVAFDARLVRAHGHLGLLLIEAAVRVVAIAAIHRALKHFVTEWLRELSVDLGVAGHTKLRLAVL